MYYYLNGTLALLEQDKAVIDCGGVGYLLSITKKTYDLLSKDAFLPDGSVAGITAKLFTYYHVGEYSTELFGFSSDNECTLFKLLIGVSGIGPKAAVAILSALSADDFVRAVIAQDAKAISAAQGIGFKSAQKIILELKDKLSGWAVSDDGAPLPEKENSADSDILKEAVNALTVLGYTRQEAVKAAKSAKGTTLEEVIRSALSSLM